MGNHVGLRSAFARLLARLRARASRAALSPEELLLEEAVVDAPIGPGMAGSISLRERRFPARAEDPAQAYARGTRVRLIDYREGGYVVEAADEEHLAR